MDSYENAKDRKESDRFTIIKLEVSEDQFGENKTIPKSRKYT